MPLVALYILLLLSELLNKSQLVSYLLSVVVSVLALLLLVVGLVLLLLLLFLVVVVLLLMLLVVVVDLLLVLVCLAYSEVFVVEDQDGLPKDDVFCLAFVYLMPCVVSALCMDGLDALPMRDEEFVLLRR